MLEMARFGVGLIPFLRNQLTDSVDPIKYYEYRALGIPVLSSSFGEMPGHAQAGGVSLIDDQSDFHLAVNRALASRDSAEAVESFRERNSWQTRFTLDAAASLRPAGTA